MIQKLLFTALCACSSNLVYSPEEVPAQSLESIASLPESTADVTRIYFVRNGESDFSAKDANGTKFTSGRSPQVPLTEKGIGQAAHLGEALASKIQNGVVYTPPAVRAEQTASLMRMHNDQILSGGAYDGLFEVGMGDWEGKPKDQAYKDVYQKWKQLSAAEKYVTPKVASGESYFDASERALVDLQAILNQEEGKTLFIVSGENLLNALAMRWTHPQLSHEAGSDLPMLPMDQCDLYMVEIPRGQPIGNGNLKLLIHSN